MFHEFEAAVMQDPNFDLLRRYLVDELTEDEQRQDAVRRALAQSLLLLQQFVLDMAWRILPR
jgi:hypothetical protein